MIEISQYVFYKLIYLLNISQNYTNITYTNLYLMEEGRLPKNTIISIKH